MTNREKLNNMTNEQLATFICETVTEICEDCSICDFCDKTTPYISCINIIVKYLESEE